MANQGGEFSFFQDIHEQPMTTKSGKQVHLHEFTHQAFAGDVITSRSRDKLKTNITSPLPEYL